MPSFAIVHLVTSLLPKIKQRHKHCFQFHAGELRVSQQILGKIEKLQDIAHVSPIHFVLM